MPPESSTYLPFHPDDVNRERSSGSSVFSCSDPEAYIVDVSYRYALGSVRRLLLLVQNCMGHSERDIPMAHLMLLMQMKQSARCFASFRDKFLDIIVTLVEVPGGVIPGSHAGTLVRKMTGDATQVAGYFIVDFYLIDLINASTNKQ